MSLLKVQVGALSKILHSTQSASSFLYLRQYVDGLIRAVASMDENVPQELDVMERTFEGVISAYDKLSQILRQNHPAANAQCDEEFRKEIRALELEIEQLNSEHGERYERRCAEFEQQLQALQERLAEREAENQRLQRELARQARQAPEPVKQAYEKTLKSLQDRHETDLQQLELHFARELEEEKEATRIALDVVQRAHEEELQALREQQLSEKEKKSALAESTDSRTR